MSLTECGAPTRRGTPCAKPVPDGRRGCRWHDPDTATVEGRALAIKKQLMLELIAEHGHYAAAIRESDVPERTFYRWLGEDGEFARDAVEARHRAAGIMYSEARRRAKDGVTRPIYQGGKLAGHVQEYSDRLMELLLRVEMPETFATDADRRVEAELRSGIWRAMVDEWQRKIDDLVTGLGLDPKDPTVKSVVGAHIAELRQSTSIRSVVATRALAAGP